MIACLKMSDPVGLTMAGKIDVLLILGKGQKKHQDALMFWVCACAASSGGAACKTELRERWCSDLWFYEVRNLFAVSLQAWSWIFSNLLQWWTVISSLMIPVACFTMQHSLITWPGSTAWTGTFSLESMFLPSMETSMPQLCESKCTTDFYFEIKCWPAGQLHDMPFSSVTDDKNDFHIGLHADDVQSNIPPQQSVSRHPRFG